MSVSGDNSENLSNVVIDKKLSAEEIEKLPEVKRRIRALKKLQFNKLEIDGELEEEVFKLIESKYRDTYYDICSKRRDIINGSVEPTDEECDFREFDSQTTESDIEVKIDGRVDGIPNFWLESMLNITQIREWISKEDELVLIHLKDIAVTRSASPPKIALEFYFGPNEYFENEVLTKEYSIGFGPDPESQGFNETEAFYATERKGCEINWKKGKNLLKKYSEYKNSIVESEQIPSFFCFFDPPEEPKDKIEIEDNLRDFLWEDWKLGLTIAEKLVPNAVLYYCGDLIGDETESESSESEDSESDSGSESE